MNALRKQLIHSLIKTNYFYIFQNKKLQTHTHQKKKKTSVPLGEKAWPQFLLA